MTNLLTNPSFEEGWYHPNNVPELQIPMGWMFWHADETVPNPHDPAEHSRFVRPKVNHKSTNTLPPDEHDKYILDGDYTLKVFKGNGAFNCKLMQNITLEAGKTYTMTIRGHADLVDHYENGSKVGAPDPVSGKLRLCLYRGPSEACTEWMLLGACTEWMLLGGDKALKPFSYTSQFKATDTIDSVSIEFMCPFPINNNGLFLDNWELVEKVVEPEPEPEPEPPTGCLREPLDIVSFLVSPRENLAAVIDTLDEVWPIFRWSLFGSADHASISCGASSVKVIASSCADWGPDGALEDFMAEYYPDVELIPFEYDIGFQLVGRALAAGLKARGLKLKNPSTYRPPWITSEFGHQRDYGPHEGLDLRGSYKTWLTRMVAAIDGEIICAGWNDSEPWYGYQVRTRTRLWGGHELLARYAHMLEGSITWNVGDTVLAGETLGHVGATGRNLDGSPSCTGDHAHIDCRLVGATIPSGTKLYCDPEMLIDFGDETQQQPAPKLPGTFLTLHRQTEVDGILQFVEQAKPRWFKLVTDIEYARHIKDASPDTKIIYRDAPNIPTQEALLQLAEIHADHIDAIEEQNETIATNDPVGAIVAVERAVNFSEQLAIRQLPVKACLLNVAVGNPGHDEVEWLLPAAEAAVLNGHYLGYHPYFPAHPQYAAEWLVSEGKHHHMRALLSWDPVFAAHGLKPKYLFTECGAIGAYVREDGRPGGYVGAGSGWRSPECLNGDWTGYLSLLLEWQKMVENWNKWHDNRAAAGMIFTVGAAYVGWDYFKLWLDELNDLADKLIENT